MLDPALDLADAAAGIALVPGAIELFRRCPELHDQIARQVRGIGLPAFLAPQPHQCGFIIAHDDSGAPASAEAAPSRDPGTPIIRHFHSYYLFRAFLYISYN